MALLDTSSELIAFGIATGVLAALSALATNAVCRHGLPGWLPFVAPSPGRHMTPAIFMGGGCECTSAKVDWFGNLADDKNPDRMPRLDVEYYEMVDAAGVKTTYQRLVLEWQFSYEFDLTGGDKPDLRLYWWLVHTLAGEKAESTPPPGKGAKLPPRARQVDRNLQKRVDSAQKDLDRATRESEKQPNSSGWQKKKAKAEEKLREARDRLSEALEGSGDTFSLVIPAETCTKVVDETETQKATIVLPRPARAAANPMGNIVGRPMAAPGAIAIELHVAVRGTCELDGVFKLGVGLQFEVPGGYAVTKRNYNPPKPER